MSYHGASPGEGPRSGWHGHENWEKDKARKRWEDLAAKDGQVVDEWMDRYRPKSGSYTHPEPTRPY